MRAPEKRHGIALWMPLSCRISHSFLGNRYTAKRISVMAVLSLVSQQQFVVTARRMRPVKPRRWRDNVLEASLKAAQVPLPFQRMHRPVRAAQKNQS
jgi:hypothetical protein